MRAAFAVWSIVPRSANASRNAFCFARVGCATLWRARHREGLSHYSFEVGDVSCCRLSPTFPSRAKHRLLGLEIDCGYRSRFKSPSGGIKFYHKLAETTGRHKPARPSHKLEDSHISACGRV